MAGLAFGIVLIILVAGEPKSPKAPAQAAQAPSAPNPDRLRDYQERLRAMETRQAQESQAATPPTALQPLQTPAALLPAPSPIARPGLLPSENLLAPVEPQPLPAPKTKAKAMKISDDE